MANSFVQAAKKVLQTEADALGKLQDNLPVDFSDLVNLILNLSGRVIVSGVGKSGHIGNKIAATLASTGTPSYFVHATEASHGDLGMITDQDLCLLISNSGETIEMLDYTELPVEHTLSMRTSAVCTAPCQTWMPSKFMQCMIHLLLMLPKFCPCSSLDSFVLMRYSSLRVEMTCVLVF